MTSFLPSTMTSQAQFSGDLDIINENGEREIQIEDLTVRGLASGTTYDDREMYIQTVYKRDAWTGFNDKQIPVVQQTTPELDDLYGQITRFNTKPPEGSADLKQVEAILDEALSSSLHEHHLGLLKACANTMPSIVPGLIREMRRDSLEQAELAGKVTQIVQDISHRQPQISVLEINLGYTSSLAEAIYDGLSVACQSMTSAYSTVSPSRASVDRIRGSMPQRYALVQIEDDDAFFALDETHGPFDLVVVGGETHSSPMGEVKEYVSRRLTVPGGFVVWINTYGQLRDKLSELLRNGLGVERCAKRTLHHTPGTTDDGELETPFVIHQTQGFGFRLTVEQPRSPVIDVLRAPLEHLGSLRLPGRAMIIGGIGAETEPIASHLMSIMNATVCQTIRIKSLREIDPVAQSDIQWVVLLADLDSAVLEAPDAASLAGLQALFSPGKSVLWLTNGFYKGANPYHSASVGLARTAKGETPNFRLQCLDLDTLLDVHDLIAETFLRFAYVSTVEAAETPASWVTESEIVLTAGEILIPRLQPIPELNRRLNCKRRAITHSGNTKSLNTGLHPPKGTGQPFYEAFILGSDVTQHQRDSEDDRVVVSVSVSSLLALKLADDLSLYLGIGTALGRKVLFFSENNASLVKVPTSWTKPFDWETSCSNEELLAQLLMEIVVSKLVRLSKSNPIAIMEPDGHLVTAVSSKLHHGPGGSIVHLTRDITRANRDPRLTFVHPHSTKRRIAEALGPQGRLIIDLAPDPIRSMQTLLAEGSGPTEAVRLFTSLSILGVSRKDCQKAISAVLMSYMEMVPSSSSGTDGLLRSKTLPLDQIIGRGLDLPYGSVIDWEADAQVEANVQPMNLGSCLNPSKTYLLVGLTGELGESLCRLMSQNGARYFVVASR